MEFSLLPLKDGAIKERMLDQIVYFNVFKLQIGPCFKFDNLKANIPVMKLCINAVMDELKKKADGK